MSEQIFVAAGYNGPAGVGNGGYMSGLLEARYGAPVEVTLSRGIPLDRAMDLEWFEDVVLVWGWMGAGSIEDSGYEVDPESHKK